MNNCRFAAIAALTLLTTSTAFGQGDFFWSFQNLGDGAVNDDVMESLDVGEVATIYLYYSTTGPAASELDTGAGLDITTSMNGVIEFQAAETFDFDITVGGTDIGDRWVDSFGPAGTVTSSAITGLNAFRVVSGTGIVDDNKGPVFFDQGWDPAADAFLFGSVTFEVVGPGTVDIDTVSGSILIVHDGAVVDASFGGATIIGKSITTVACCFSNGGCVDLEAGECDMYGGASQGDGTDCAGSSTACLASIPTVGTWGLIVLGLLMLTAGTIAIRREMTRGVTA